jgi:hypothetical protein
MFPLLQKTVRPMGSDAATKRQAKARQHLPPN